MSSARKESLISIVRNQEIKEDRSYHVQLLSLREWLETRSITKSSKLQHLTFSIFYLCTFLFFIVKEEKKNLKSEGNAQEATMRGCRNGASKTGAE